MDNKRNLVFAYLLWLPPLGFFGAHRFFLNKTISANFFLATFGIAGLGWIWDSVYTYYMVKDYSINNLKKVVPDEQILNELNANKMAFISEELPLWLHPESTFEALKAYFELFLITILIIVSFMVFHQVDAEELFAFLLLFYIIISFPRQSVFLKKRIIFLEYILNLDVINSVLNAEKYYFDNQPKNILFYLFFPITFPFFVLSKKIRPEINIFQRIWIGAAVAFTLIMLYKLFYGTIKLGEVKNHCVTLFLTSGVFISLIILMLNSNFRSKDDDFRQVSIAYRIVTCIAVCGCIAYILIPAHFDNQSSIKSSYLLERRLQEPKFNKTFKLAVQTFMQRNISYYEIMVTEVDTLQYSKNFIYFLQGNDELNIDNKQAKRCSLFFTKANSSVQFTLDKNLIEIIQISPVNLINPMDSIDEFNDYF